MSRLFYRIKQRYYSLKQRWQRSKKGYSYIDIWGFNDWFLDIVPRMLEELSKECHGHPIDMTYEEWIEYLNTMSMHFKEAAKYDDLDFDKNISFKDNLTLQEQAYSNCKEHLETGLDMLKARFFDLWD